MEAERASLSVKPRNRSPALIDDRFNTRFRRQRVIDSRERDSVRHTISRRKKRFILRQFLPIAAVNENEQRRITRSSGEKIQGFVRLVTPLQILLANERLLRLAAPKRILR